MEVVFASLAITFLLEIDDEVLFSSPVTTGEGGFTLLLFSSLRG